MKVFTKIEHSDVENAKTGFTKTIVSFGDMKAKLSETNGKSLLLFKNVAKFNKRNLEVDTSTKYKKYFEDFEQEYKVVRTHENTRINNERSILTMLDKFYEDLGIGIYRAVETNGNITGWQRMFLNTSGNPAYTNC